jgi:Carboxypeptidase regulatory-like domain/TonB-dependent Receptor Plug Domain
LCPEHILRPQGPPAPQRGRPGAGGTARVAGRDRRSYLDIMRLFLTLAAALPAILTTVAPPLPPAVAHATLASVSGIVYDSLAGAPLPDAIVQLVNAESVGASARTVNADSSGRFRIDSVPAGRYLIGFLHPTLDSLGVEPTPREVFVDGRAALRVDLFIPAAQSLRRGVCGEQSVADSTALILGFARHATGKAPVDSADITLQWIELSLVSGQFAKSRERRAVRTQETGWFAICGAPVGGTVLLQATHGGDSTAALELEIPASGVVRRDLYFGAARLVGVDTAQRGEDSVMVDAAPRYAGDGRISGTVLAARGRRPLGGARVGIVNGPFTRADDRGQWILTGVPTGTRTLEVRAVAHVPVSMAVDVVDDAAPIEVQMVTLQSVLDTIVVTAKRGSANRNLAEFMQRRRSAGAGRFLGQADIASRNPVFTSDLFRSVPGVQVDRTRNGDEIITMRGNSLTSARCQPSIFINGMSLRGLSATDINGFIRPNELIGVEIYTNATAPVQYSEMNGCGAILFWSR